MEAYYYSLYLMSETGQ